MKSKINNNIIKLYTPFKYVFSSGISFVIDQVIFNVLIIILKNNIFIIISKLISRAISSFINYLLNSRVVFKERSRGAIVKYYLLVIVQAIISSVLIYSLKIFLIFIPVGIISVIVDVFLFIINYFVQKKFIFKKD